MYPVPNYAPFQDGEEEVQIHTLLTSTPDGSRWSASCPGHFNPYPPRKRAPGTQ